MDKRIEIIGEDSCLLCEIEQNGECKLFSKKISVNSPYVTLLNAMFSSSNSSSNSPSLTEVKNGIIYYSIGDLIKSEKDGTELKNVMDLLLETITEKEREVITLRYGINDNIHRTLEDVGEKLNLSRERICQIEAKALRKLLHPSRMCSITNTKKRHIEINEEIEDYSIGVKYSSGLINILKSEIRKYLNCDISVRNYFI